MERGKFIVIEGIDGAGKTTQVNLLAKKISQLNIPVETTRECSDGPVGKLLRQLYLPGNRYLDSKLLTLLYATDRYDHIMNPEDGIISKLDKGINVISDRYYLSSFALHQLLDDNLEDRITTRIFVANINEINMINLSPDITININTSAQNAVKNLSMRDDDSTIFESMKQIEGAYQTYPKAIEFMKKIYGDDVTSIDGNRSIEEIHDDIWNIVYPLLSKS